MPESPKKIGISFRERSQERAKQTFSDLLQTASKLVEGGDPDLFTSRSLAQRSGYALGTLSKHLGKIDNVFLWIILEGRTRNISKLQAIIDQFSPVSPLVELIEQMVDMSFHEIQRVNPKVIRYFQSRAIRRVDEPWSLNKFTDALLSSWMDAIARDQTGTFAKLSEEEAKWCLRTSLVFVEHPFVELNPIAGNEVHRKMAVDRLTRLFSN